MGKHIIIFITAILMPFMAYGANCSGVPENECNTTAGCEWIVDEISSSAGCEPCGVGTYKKGDNPDIIYCIACTNAPADCGTNGSLCKWIGDETKPSNNFVFSGLTSNTCPWEMNKVDMTITYLGSEPIDISATLSNVDGGNTTGDETKLVIKTSDQNEIFSTISKSFDNNQIDFDIQLNNGKTCTINSMIDNSNQWTLVSNVCSLSNAQISSLTVTAKDFQYVLVPMNSVPDTSEINFNLIKNTYEYKDSVKFGTDVSLPTGVTYYQYNNCEYYGSTVNCKFDDNTKPTTPSDKINYKFEYIDNTIIVLERATCTAGKHCPTYITTGDENCPDAFWSDENSATSITDCYLDSSVTFIDKNGEEKLITGENTKVYYQGNSTQ